MLHNIQILLSGEHPSRQDAPFVALFLYPSSHSFHFPSFLLPQGSILEQNLKLKAYKEPQMDSISHSMLHFL
jgi:hypothetical protein